MENNNIVKKLRQLAIDSSNKAYSPYSKFKVGSSLVTSDGSFYNGCNIENSSYGATVCAERVAIFKAISEQGKIMISKLYVYTDAGWPPCGMCRQVISEFSSQDTEIIVGDKNGKEKTVKFNDLFPDGFIPDHLKN